MSRVAHVNESWHTHAQVQGDTLWAVALSALFFMLLFVCLYALSAWARGARYTHTHTCIHTHTHTHIHTHTNANEC